MPLCTHKGDEGLTYPTVHSFEAEHPTVAILQRKRAAYPTVHTQGRGRADRPIPLCTLLRLSIPLLPFYKGKEPPIPLCTHKGEEELTYPTVHTFEAEHPTVAILQRKRAAYPTVHPQGRGRADLSHCAHF